jgi:hypothetical protein
MSKAWSLVPMGEVLTPVSRPENVDPQVTYHILGAHWYAEGLYTKEVKPGSQIQATKLYRVKVTSFITVSSLGRARSLSPRKKITAAMSQTSFRASLSTVILPTDSISGDISAAPQCGGKRSA